MRNELSKMNIIKGKEGTSWSVNLGFFQDGEVLKQPAEILTGESAGHQLARPSSLLQPERQMYFNTKKGIL